ncbi:cytochrome P450 [Amycolatopsis sp. NPDC059021]|uniref:cytochrome P450 family protein n=1 Tax=Amycolatopsis sp. NPDC059021 TaxID=3346704 RepID=UPI0036706562
MTTSEGMVDLTDAELVRDPFTAYSRIRERAALAKAVVPGIEPMWLVTRYDDVKLVMSDPRFVSSAAAVPGAVDLREQLWRATGIPEEHFVYLKAGVSEVDGAEHARLRGLVTRAFTVRRVTELRPRIAELTERLLDELPGRAEDGVVDLLRHFAYPLPIAVICELVGIPEKDRPQWRDWSAALAAGFGPGVAEALAGMVDHVRVLLEFRRHHPADDLITGLVRAQAEDGDRLSDVEMIALVQNLVVAGHETTAHLLANGTAALLTHPDQLALLRADPALLPKAVHELMRWCGPGLGTRMRYAAEDVEIGGELVRRGEAVMPVLAGANYDPREFATPERLDITRDPGRAETHVGFGAGPHYCLGAALARQEAEIAFGALFRRYPGLALAVEPEELRHGPNPGTWQLDALPVRW